MEFYGLCVCPDCSTVLGRIGVCKDICFGVWVQRLLLYTVSITRVQKYVAPVGKHKPFEERDNVHREATNAQLPLDAPLT
jgi:hypothetical protein